jgi:hypothetical protein
MIVTAQIHTLPTAPIDPAGHKRQYVKMVAGLGAQHAHTRERGILTGNMKEERGAVWFEVDFGRRDRRYVPSRSIRYWLPATAGAGDAA